MDLPWEQLQSLVSSDPSQKLFVFVVIWVMVKKAMREHLTRIEASIQSVVVSINDLSKSQIKLETAHNNRISALEEYFEAINKELISLKLSKEATNGKGV